MLKWLGTSSRWFPQSRLELLCPGRDHVCQRSNWMNEHINYLSAVRSTLECYSFNLHYFNCRFSIHCRLFCFGFNFPLRVFFRFSRFISFHFRPNSPLPYLSTNCTFQRHFVCKFVFLLRIIPLLLLLATRYYFELLIKANWVNAYKGLPLHKHPSCVIINIFFPRYSFVYRFSNLFFDFSRNHCTPT